MKRLKNFSVGEIQVRYRPRKVYSPVTITCSKDSYNLVKEFFNKNTVALQEQFVVMYLNQANKVLGFYCISYGGITATVADIRIILAVAVTTASVKIIVAHNHPSGNLSPSAYDKELTKRLKESASLMEIKLLDHLIIIPSGQYTSMADEGFM